MKILSKIHLINKAYIEGIYADTPQNRKLGRVGMSYVDYNSIIENEEDKAYYFFHKEDFSDNEEVLNWINKYISRFGGDLNPEQTKNFIKIFEKRYEIEGQGERILRGLINWKSQKYGYSGSFDTNFGLYNIHLEKKKNKKDEKNNKVIEGIYADTPANRKLGRVGMTYSAWGEKLKEEEEKNAEKKFYYIELKDEAFMLEEGKTSQKKAIDLTIDYVKSMVENNGYNEFSCTLNENIDNWSEEDIENKKWDWFNIRAEKYGDKVEISVYDYNEGKYIRNDKAERENRNLNQRMKRLEKKQKEEFDKKFGWLEELVEYNKEKNSLHLKDYKLDIRNDDNVLNVFVKDNTGRIFGGAEATKDIEDKTIYLDSLNLDPEYRGKGLGGELLQKFIDISKEDKNFNKIVLEVDSGLNYDGNPTEEEKIKNNKKLSDFYKTFGFKVVESEGTYIDMELNLKNK